MHKAAIRKTGVMSALRLAASRPAWPSEWRYKALCGRLVELSASGASAALTLAFSLLHDAQKAGESVAWITRKESVFFPPDVAEGGIDLDALPVVRLDSGPGLLRAADHLARSDAFGLIVLDLGRQAAISVSAQTRLSALAARYNLVMLCLTRKDSGAPSLGSLVSLRAEAVRRDAGENRFVCRLRACKDKRRGPGWEYLEFCHGPSGLR